MKPDRQNVLADTTMNFIPSCITIYGAMRYYSNTWRMMKSFFCTLAILTFSLCLHAQTAKEKWVDSVFRTLDTEAKIRQMFVSSLSSHWEKNQLNNLEKELKDGLGGIFFTSGHPEKQLALTRQYQNEAKVPLFVAVDVVNGLGSKLDSTLRYPLPLAQSAFDNDSLIYQIGQKTARDLRMLGVNMNIGVNANLASPDGDFGWSSQYGDKRAAITQSASAYMKGLQSENMLAGAKYFPIQGLTIKDLIKKDVVVVETRADTAQVGAFLDLFDAGIDAVVAATTDLPVFIEKPKVAKKNKLPGSVLSSAYAGTWIRNNSSYKGLFIVDLRLSKSSNKKIKNGDAELAAFLGGNDLIITDENISPAVRRIRRFIRKQDEYKPQLDNLVKRVLAAKYDAALFAKPVLNEENIVLRLNNADSKVFQRKLIQSAVTVLQNENNLLPLLTLENRRFATVFLGDTTQGNQFQETVSKYVNARHLIVRNEKDLRKTENIFRNNDLIILGVTSATPAMLLDSVARYVRADTSKQVVVADFGCTALYNYHDAFQSVVTIYQDGAEFLKMLPQAIFGATAATGKFPASVSTLKAGTSIKTKSLKRLQYSFPEDAGMSSSTLRKIESIAQEAIDIGGAPGCYVLIAKDGKVVYQKAFGHLTYEKQIPVTDSTIYDLASVTKVSATLQTTMFLYDRGLIDINKKASAYLPELRNSNKENFTLKDILTHQAGLWPFLPFWAQTMKDNNYLPEYYSSTLSMKYPYLVADKLYAVSSIRDSLWTWIIRSKVREKAARTPYDYKYSDMGFYILQHVSERILNQPVDDFLSQNLYEPLGAYTTGYLPLSHFRPNRIAPTEDDKLFRKTLLIGTVHDQGAAMLGGVGGHAGLFSTGNDLAKLCQMLLQEGYYGGYQYYKPETVRLFTRKQFETSKRGLGWDRPVQSDNTGVTSMYASQRTFGHTGFTGTCIWMDPEFNVVYIFLSNRVHPDMTNNKLLNANIRSRIQDVVYQSIFDYCKRGVAEPRSESTSFTSSTQRVKQ